MLEQIERDVLPRVRHAPGPRHPPHQPVAARVPPVFAPPVRMPAFKPHLARQRQAKALAMAESAALRRLDAVRCLLRHGAEQHIERVETTAYAAARPEVSVIVSLYNYAGVVTETLDSIVASEDVDLEVIVVDDHATDCSREVVREFLDAHPDVPMLLLGKDANEGLAAARNTAFAAARSDLVMVLDADNTIYPDLPAQARRCPASRAGRGRRVRDPCGLRAAASRPQCDRLGRRAAVPCELHRRPGDDPAQHVGASRRLPGGRRSRLRVGGLGPVAAPRARTVVTRSSCRRSSAATASQHGSMIALTNLASDDAIAAMRARYPRLPWPAPTGWHSAPEPGPTDPHRYTAPAYVTPNRGCESQPALPAVAEGAAHPLQEVGARVGLEPAEPAVADAASSR